MARVYGWAPEQSEQPLQPQQNLESRVGQAFQPDFPKSQAGKPDLQSRLPPGGSRPRCHRFEHLPLIRGGQFGNHRSEAVARVVRVMYGDGPAPIGVFPEPPASVVFALRVDVDMKQVDSLPPGCDLERVGLDECESLIRDVMPLQRVYPPDSPVVTARALPPGTRRKCCVQSERPAPQRPAAPKALIRSKVVRPKRRHNRPPRAGDDPRSGLLGLRVARRHPLHSSQLRRRLAIARALDQHLTPRPLGPGTIAALGGQGRQVASGQMTIDPLVDAELRI